MTWLFERSLENDDVFRPRVAPEISRSQLCEASRCCLMPCQAIHTKATRKELQGAYDAAFHLYIECAQACVALMRQADSQCAIPSFKEKCRATSSKAVQRAEKIKGLRQHLKAAKPSLQTAHAQEDVLVQSEDLPCGRCRAWSDELALPEALARIE
jgi:hypothetical protein